MKLSKKLAIIIISSVLIISASVIAVLASTLVSVSNSAVVSFDIGNDIQGKIWCQRICFDNSGTVIDSKAITFYSFNANSASQILSGSDNTAMTFSSSTDYWMLIVYVENWGQNAFDVEIAQTPEPNTIANISNGNYKKGQTLSLSGTELSQSSTFQSLTGEGVNASFANNKATENVAGSSSVGSVGGTICLTRKFTVTASTADVTQESSSVSWTIKLTKTNS